MNKCYLAFWVVLSVCLAYKAEAESGVVFSYFHGQGDLVGSRLAYRSESKPVGLKFKSFDVHFETGLSRLKFNGRNSDEVNYVISFSPVFRYRIASWGSKIMHLNFGIGISYFLKDDFADKQLGTKYQFEDRVGVVYQFGSWRKHKLGLHYFHYSNGGLDEDNPGLDFLNLSYQYYH